MAVTIKDVARESGTTIGTVSKALNNHYSIPGETVERIKKVAEQIGYKPNARAQTFARQATREVVFLTQLPRDIAFTNPHMFEILAGAEASLLDKGYAIKLRGCDTASVCELVKDIMDSKKADGLLIHASVVTRELAFVLTKAEIPHIVIGKPNFGSALCWIDNNNKLAGDTAAAYLLEKGHKRISFIGGKDEDKISADRLDGVKYRLKDDKLFLEIVLLGESTVSDGMRLTKELVENQRPEAIVCANNYLAMGCIQALQYSGLSVPKDISVITFDDYPFARITSPTLTNVNIDVYDMGATAGKLLVKKISQPHMQVQSFMTLPTVIERESVQAKS